MAHGVLLQVEDVLVGEGVGRSSSGCHEANGGEEEDLEHRAEAVYRIRAEVVELQCC